MSTIPDEPSKPKYAQGHSASVVASHMSRTVENSASFLTPHLKPDSVIVDLGCGPGTITRGFCAFVPNGQVIGLDSSDAIVEQARAVNPASEYPNLSFRVADITDRLPFDDASVDVVYTHQTLLHIPSPITVIREAFRILKPRGGMLAMREADHVSIQPESPVVEQYWRHVFSSFRGMGAQGDGCGRRLHLWAQEAGFDRAKMLVGAGATVYTAPEESKWWAGLHVGRLEGEIGEKWLQNKTVASQEEIERFKTALKTWGDHREAWYGLMQGEVICWK
ncbi:hypothetical protein PV08_10998 [Exophiala spinifera]|uniref:Methyltransferase domain-containing protein n=1 Tax=Exophiala spinifera TaxID=91928 RepID=A0A0D1Y9N3_9EURO|nr:uncharacterized protein PV08_10998 [Exophiala spinifera]KIW11696.1 hypothetical protein PV08_10998 [Exophiala spinifera]